MVVVIMLVVVEWSVFGTWHTMNGLNGVVLIRQLVVLGQKGSTDDYISDLIGIMCKIITKYNYITKEIRKQEMRRVLDDSKMS